MLFPAPDAASKVSGVPQSPQKPRAMASELWNILRWPRGQTTWPTATEANAPNGAANAFWHMRQWQMLVWRISPSTRNRTTPHWHPPESSLTTALRSRGDRRDR